MLFSCFLYFYEFHSTSCLFCSHFTFDILRAFSFSDTSLLFSISPILCKCTHTRTHIICTISVNGYIQTRIHNTAFDFVVVDYKFSFALFFLLVFFFRFISCVCVFCCLSSHMIFFLFRLYFFWPTCVQWLKWRLCNESTSFVFHFGRKIIFSQICCWYRHYEAVRHCIAFFLSLCFLFICSGYCSLELLLIFFLRPNSFFLFECFIVYKNIGGIWS